MAPECVVYWILENLEQAALEVSGSSVLLRGIGKSSWEKKLDLNNLFLIIYCL